MNGVLSSDPVRRNPRYDRWIKLVEVRLGKQLEDTGFTLNEIYEAVAEGVLEGWSYLVLCGSCGSWEYCVVASATYEGEGFEVKPVGLRASVGEGHPFDEVVERMFSISKTVVKRGGRVFFYIPLEYAKSVKILLCGDSRPSGIRVEELLFEEVEFIGGGE